MHSAVKIKLFSSFLLALFFGLQGASIAQASDIPTLQWERGRQQVITLGGQTADKLWSIDLVGKGKTLTFNRSSVNKAGFLVYSVDIPASFSVGDYEIHVSGPQEATTTTAYVKILEQVSYDPLTDPKGVGVIAVIAFTLLSFFAGSKPGIDQSSSDEASSLGSVEKEYQGVAFEQTGRLDQTRLTKSSLTRKLDELRHVWILESSPRSPLISRLISDGTYTQSLIGPFALVLPLFGIGLGYQIAHVMKANNGLVPTSLGLMSAAVILGVFDAFAGLLAFITFTATVATEGRIHNAVDIRTLLGLSLIWFTPSLVAGAARPLRRNKNEWQLWERLTDLAISTLLAGLAIKEMTAALDGFSHQKTLLAEHSKEIAIAGGIAVIVRFLIEEMATRLAPRRVEYLTPPRVKEQYLDSFIYSILVKIVIYFFFMFGFFGLCWQMFTATAILILPGLFKRFAGKLPNVPWLWQLIPGGIPSIVIMSFIGFEFTHWVNSQPLVSSDKTKTILIITSLPGFAVGLLKLFGRTPKQGDVRWYRRENFRFFYRFSGPIMLVIAVLMTTGVLP